MLNNMKNKILKINRGFTLIETLVSVLLLAMALSAVFTLMGSTVFASRYAKNEITASYLAQEAIDFIRNDRDSLGFQQNDWVSFLDHYGYNTQNATSSFCFTSNGCDIDAETLYIISSNQIPGTNFTRKIEMFLPNGNTDQISVVVTVNWDNGLASKSQTLSVSLLKWR